MVEQPDWRIAPASRLAKALLAIILTIAGARVATTWSVFSQTYDESAHIAAGMEWLTHGTYEGEPQHPPVARVAAAVGPWLDGARLPEGMSQTAQGNEILHSGDYTTRLALARAGILPFFLLSIWGVWSYARRLAGDIAAPAAAALYANEPTVLAHAGLATTDMAFTACLLLVVLAIHCWLVTPSPGRATLVGLALGAVAGAKFSALLFVPVAAAATLVCVRAGRGPLAGTAKQRLTQLLLIALVAAVALWGIYRFDFQSLTGKHRDLTGALLIEAGTPGWALEAIDGTPLPATPLISGIAEMLLHNRDGHHAFLLGEYRVGSWWYYFPVALAVKSTPGFLVACLAASIIVLSCRSKRSALPVVAPACAALAILVVSLTANINIGVRHVLPVYPLLSVTAGCAIALLWNRSRMHRVAIALFLLGSLGASASAHPDYLAYFNVLAGERPERVLNDSNLDWGQDVLRLSDRASELGIDALRFSYFGTADLARHDLPLLLPVSYDTPAPGWFAVSISNLGSRSNPVTFDWLEHYEPVERIGSSILLYRIPGEPAAPSAHAPPGHPSFAAAIVPLPLGETRGSDRLWTTRLEVTNDGDRSVTLIDSAGRTHTVTPAQTMAWPHDTSGIAATLLYTLPEYARMITGTIHVESVVDGEPQQDRISIPLVTDALRSRDPIELQVPGCTTCRRTLRVFDGNLVPSTVRIEARRGDAVITRQLPLTRTSGPSEVAAAAQLDLDALFPEIGVSAETDVTITGPGQDSSIWAFVTLSGADQHTAILPQPPPRQMSGAISTKSRFR